MIKFVVETVKGVPLFSYTGSFVPTRYHDLCVNGKFYQVERTVSVIVPVGVPEGTKVDLPYAHEMREEIVRVIVMAPL